MTTAEVVTQAEFGAFKGETREYQQGLASAVVDLQDGLADMQTGLTKTRKAVNKMADLLNGDGS